MPEATPFMALEVGNGFPFIPERVNVENFDYWITLGGTQKGSTPTPLEIATSHINAVKFYWSLYRANFTLSATSPSYSATLSSALLKKLGLTDMPTPVQRACAPRLEFEEFVIDPPFTFVALGQSVIGPVEMYNGVTTDNNNFVGFGIKTFMRLEASGRRPESKVTLHSYKYATPINTSDQIVDVQYATFQGFPVVSYASAKKRSNAGSLSANALAFTASAVDGNINEETVATMGSFEFYTYPNT